MSVVTLTVTETLSSRTSEWVSMSDCQRLLEHSPNCMVVDYVGSWRAVRPTLCRCRRAISIPAVRRTIAYRTGHLSSVRSSLRHPEGCRWHIASAALQPVRASSAGVDARCVQSIIENEIKNDWRAHVHHGAELRAQVRDWGSLVNVAVHFTDNIILPFTLSRTQVCCRSANRYRPVTIIITTRML